MLEVVEDELRVVVAPEAERPALVEAYVWDTAEDAVTSERQPTVVLGAGAAARLR